MYFLLLIFLALGLIVISHDPFLQIKNSISSKLLSDIYSHVLKYSHGHEANVYGVLNKFFP